MTSHGLGACQVNEESARDSPHLHVLASRSDQGPAGPDEVSVFRLAHFDVRELGESVRELSGETLRHVLDDEDPESDVGV